MWKTEILQINNVTNRILILLNTFCILGIFTVHASVKIEKRSIFRKQNCLIFNFQMKQNSRNFGKKKKKIDDKLTCFIDDI